jgi:mRNA interferase MazF
MSVERWSIWQANLDPVVLCYQIRTVDKRRFSRLYGRLNEPARQEEILTALCFQLGITR